MAAASTATANGGTTRECRRPISTPPSTRYACAAGRYRPG